VAQEANAAAEEEEEADEGKGQVKSLNKSRFCFFSACFFANPIFGNCSKTQTKDLLPN
jgi:hypothetical protein